jgi:hypothetical protein
LKNLNRQKPSEKKWLQKLAEDSEKRNNESGLSKKSMRKTEKRHYKSLNKEILAQDHKAEPEASPHRAGPSNRLHKRQKNGAKTFLLKKQTTNKV